jgi:hypothetical protein
MKSLKDQLSALWTTLVVFFLLGLLRLLGVREYPND